MRGRLIKQSIASDGARITARYGTGCVGTEYVLYRNDVEIGRYRSAMKVWQEFIRYAEWGR